MLARGFTRLQFTTFIDNTWIFLLDNIFKVCIFLSDNALSGQLATSPNVQPVLKQVRPLIVQVSTQQNLSPSVVIQTKSMESKWLNAWETAAYLDWARGNFLDGVKLEFLKQVYTTVVSFQVEILHSFIKSSYMK